MAYEDEKKGELETLLNDILEDKNTNLTPENLKKGVTVLGVDGNYIGTDTSDATATNEDVLEGKTAYAQGQKLTGTLRVEDVDSVLDMFPSIETEISEEIDIKDAVENSFNDLSIYGNSRQGSTEGYNLFDYLNNIRNTSGNNITVEKDDKMGYIIVNGTPNVNYAIIASNLNITDLIEDKQTYTLKQENANNLSINYIYSQIIIENKETLQKQYIGTRTTFKQTFTVDKTTNNYYANIQTGTIENTGTLNNFKTRFMIYKGTDDKPFELYTGGNPSPNPDYPQKIESIKDSITFKRIGKNIISINEKVGSGKKQLIINTDDSSKALQPFKLKKGDKVTVSYKMSNIQILNNSFLCTRKGDMSYNYPFNGTTGTITIENDIDYIGLVVYLTEVVDSNFKIYDIQIEKGTEATEYEPYHEDVYNLPIQQEMLEEDTFEKVDGNWYEVHNRTFYECTGEENWLREEINSSGKYRYGFYNYQFGTAKNRYSESICTHFKNFNQYGVVDNTFGIEQKYIRFNFNPLKTFNSVEEFKNWLVEQKNGGIPVRIYYYLETPTKLPCTAEQITVLNQLEQFKLDKGINHIFSDDELSPKFQLKYYRDINIMLESEITNNAENRFNIFYNSKVEEFNTNADNKLEKYNTNATSKINEYDTNADEKLKGYNTNATNKINEYNTNADEKLEEYNTNAEDKLNEYNTNAEDELTEFNSNATEKTTAYNDNASEKLSEYNTNATNKINEYNTNAEAILKILPKTETEVQENIDIDDAAESSFNKLSVYGNSRQASTEGYNLLNNTLQSQIINGVTVTVNKDRSITLNGTSTAAITLNYTNDFGIVNGDYIFYLIGKNNKINLQGIENEETIAYLAFSNNNNNVKKNYETDTIITRVFSYISAGTTFNNETFYPMITKGTEEKTYEPYTGGKASPNPDYSQEIESIKDSITFKRIGKNIISINEKVGSGKKQLIINTDDSSKALQPFKLKKGDKVTVSYKMSNIQILNNSFLCTRKGDMSYNYPFNGTTGTITIENDIDYIGLVVYLTEVVDSNFKIYDIQIEKGTEATEYEPYHEDVYNLPIQQEMLEEDTFEKVDGNWYEVHNRTFYECTGEENWLREEINSSGKYRYGFYNYQFGTAKNRYSESICTHFKNFNQYGVVDNTFGIEQKYIRFNFNPLKTFNSVEEFKNWLVEQKNGGIPVRIYYYLETPTKLPCTAEQITVLNQLEQFSLDKGINYIYSDDEVSPKFQLKYYQDINILLDKINKNIADVSAQLIEGGSNV